MKLLRFFSKMANVFGMAMFKFFPKHVYIYCSGQMTSIYIHHVSTKLKCSNLTIGFHDANWMIVLTDYLSSIGLSQSSITLTFSSDVCRFAILPPQQQIPNDQIKQFLFEQLLKQTFPGFDVQQFVFVCDEMIFNQPSLVIALPSALHKALQGCASKLNVVDAMPSILRAWQYFSPCLTAEPMYFVEGERSFRITHDGKYPTGIVALPQGVSSTQQQIFDVSQPFAVEAEYSQSLLTLMPPVQFKSYSPQQAINFMSAGLV